VLKQRNDTQHEVSKAGQNCTLAKLIRREAGCVGQSGNAKTDQKIARLTSSLHEKNEAFESMIYPTGWLCSGM
jgi:hypothetical protein